MDGKKEAGIPNMTDDFEPSEQAPPDARHYTRPVAPDNPGQLLAEEHVLAAILLHGATPDLSASHFTDPANARIYLRLQSLPVKSVESLAADFGAQLNEVGGWTKLLSLSDESKYPTSAHAGFFADALRKAHLQRSLVKASAIIKDRGIDDPEGVASDLRRLVAVATGQKTDIAPLAMRSVFDFPLIHDGDASILLGERYLNRGDGAVIVSTSGMGKSAMCVQGATELALNKGPFGIKGNGPLKSLIIQSEDSDGDIAEVAYSVKHVLNLTPEQISDVNSKVKVVTDRINRGTRFIAALKQHIVDFKPDLVWINPLQAFIDGDVTDSKDLGSFLREGLNSLNNPPSFGYVIIHHTTKPATGKERADRQWHEVMYDMAGGAEIINWARAILSLRATPTEGEFNLVLAKRGRRAGVTKQVPSGVGFRLEPVTVIPLKHAEGHIDIPGHKRGIPKIYWEGRVATEESEAPKNKGGRPVTHPFEHYVKVFPAKETNGLPLNELTRQCDRQAPIRRDALYHALKRWIKEGHVEAVTDPGKDDRYRKAT